VNALLAATVLPLAAVQLVRLSLDELRR